jgi:hypothetical protein
MKNNGRRLFPVRRRAGPASGGAEESEAEPSSSSPRDSALAEENAQIREEIDRNQLLFNQATEKLRRKVRTLDREWEAQRALHAHSLRRLRDQTEAQAQAIQALESAWRTAITTAPFDDGEELLAAKAQLDRELAMSGESAAKLESAVAFLDRESETVNWLMDRIPFSDSSLQDLAVRELSFRFEREVHGIQIRADELEADLESLENSIRLVKTVSGGLKAENELLKGRIAKAREFEEEVITAFQQITDDSQSVNGRVSEVELTALIQETQQKTKRELAQLRLEFEGRFQSIEPSPQYLTGEIEVKENDTELLNAKIRELFGGIRSNDE